MNDDVLTRKDVALLLKTTERSVTRLVASKKLVRRVDGKFDAEAVETYLREKQEATEVEEEEAQAIESKAVEALVQNNRDLMGHNKELMSALLTLNRSTHEALTQTNKDLLNRESEREKAHVDMTTALGELLLHKSEREARQLEAEARSKQIDKMGDVAAAFVPKLMSQATGREAFHELLANMTDDEKKALPNIASFFTSDKAKSAFLKVLTSMGVVETSNDDTKGKADGSQTNSNE